jgi:hypothetical protein
MQYSDCIGTTIFGDLRSLACLRLLASRGLQIVTLLARAIDVNQRKSLLGSDFAFEFIFGSNDLNYFILRSCLQYLLFECVPPDVETVLQIIDGFLLVPGESEDDEGIVRFMIRIDVLKKLAKTKTLFAKSKAIFALNTTAAALTVTAASTQMTAVFYR